MILATKTATTAASIRADTSFRQAVAFADPTSRERKKSAATIAGRYMNGTSEILGTDPIGSVVFMENLTFIATYLPSCVGTATVNFK